MIAAANQITMFDGSSALELESFTKNCMRYAKAAYDGPVGTLLSFWQKKLIKKLFIQYGLPWVEWTIPPDAEIDPVMPGAGTTQLQMTIYNATCVRNEKVRKISAVYKAAVQACAEKFESRLGPEPLRLISLESTLASDEKIMFRVLAANYSKTGIEPLEALIAKLAGPIDFAKPFSSFVGECKNTYAVFQQRTGTEIPDTLKMIWLRGAVANTKHLLDAREDYSKLNPDLEDQSFDGLLDTIRAAASKHEETHPPTAPSLFGGAATGANATLFLRNNGKSWTAQQIKDYATLPYKNWTKFCYTCGSGCPHDSATHQVSRDGQKNANHDDTILQPGRGGKQGPFKASVYHEAVKLKAKYNIV